MQAVKKSTKAVLLSALIFPGLGHLYLKRFLAGLLLLGGAAAMLYYLASVTITRALAVVEQIQTAGGPLDIDGIAELVQRQAQAGGNSATTAASLALLVIWLVGIVDSYRSARRQQH
jgi:hypothetical protein